MDVTMYSDTWWMALKEKALLQLFRWTQPLPCGYVVMNFLESLLPLNGFALSIMSSYTKFV